MPLWLRKFTYNEIYTARKEEADAIKKSANRGKGTNIDLNNPGKNIPKQAFNQPTNKGLKSKPTYITKASKK